jgi:hypothetical protein
MTNASLVLSTAEWDLTLDDAGNIAVASSPNNLAQDAASGIQTYLGEYFWDITVGVPWLTRVLGVNPPPPLALLKELLVDAALESNPEIASAQVFITSLSNRGVSGQVQVVPIGGGVLQAASFSIVNPQGAG